jgi:anti-sigma factor RsiW
MPDCASVASLVTAYVDGELSAEDRGSIDAHLRSCAPCRSRVVVEHSVRELLAARRSQLCEPTAPAALRERCASLAGPSGSLFVPRMSAWPARFARVGLAASLILVVGLAFLYQLTARSSRVLAAELAADHVKCFALNGVRHPQSAAQVERLMAAGFGWQVRLPAGAADAGLELFGTRPCLYGEGRTAHIMYYHQGRPLSLFMLPNRRRAEQMTRALGHEAAIWSSGDRTFVLVGREAKSEIQRLAVFIRASMK